MSDNLEKMEKKKIKRHINKLAGILIGYSSMVYVVTIGYIITKIIGITIRNYENKQIADQLIEELLVDLLSNGILPIIGVILGMVFILLYRKKQFFTYDLIYINHKMKVKSFLLLFICFMAPQFLFDISGKVLESILNQFGYSILESINLASQQSGTLSMFLYAVLFGPIAEEFVFRGAVLRSLEKYGKVFAIIISSILFGAVHANIVQGFYAITVGLVLGYVAIEYSIKWSILIHILNNLLSDVIMYLYSNMSDTISNYIDLIIFGVIFATSCIILYYKRKKIKDYLQSNSKDKKIYLYTFTSLWMIVFLIVNGLLALSGIEKLTP